MMAGQSYRFSPLRLGLGERLAIAALGIALIWGSVLWAIS
jgi:hypothetical protein